MEDLKNKNFDIRIHQWNFIKLVNRYNIGMHQQFLNTEVIYCLCLLNDSKKYYIHCKTHCNLSFRKYIFENMYSQIYVGYFIKY
jgi:hypothetical protein